MEALFGGPWGPVLIFGLRIVDVSLGTVRILLSVRGHRLLVPIIGFFEVLLWIFAVGNAIRELDSLFHVLGYAAGFSAGTIVGIWIEEKLAIGISTMRIITPHTGAELASRLRELGCGVTEFLGQGRFGAVQLVYTVVPRRTMPTVLTEIERIDPDAFVTVEEPREIRRGWMFSTPRLRVGAALGVGEWMRRTAKRQIP